jgi:hypothetical protein
MNIEIHHDPAITCGLEQAKVLQRALDQLHESGGGTLSIGPGVYTTTTLFMKSGIDLHLQRGCVIRAHHDLSDYPQVATASNNKDQSPYHLIVAEQCHDFSISGYGCIDGQDEAFWVPCENKEDRPYGIFRFTVKGGQKGRPSPLIQLVACSNFKLKDFTVIAPPGWSLHIFNCDHVGVDGLTLRGHPYGPNTDGIGVNGSRDVTISNCDVDTGDDAIIIKSTNDGSRCERVTVSNCTLASNCAALGLGADVDGVIRDVVFSNCVVKKSLRMIQVEMWFPGQVERAVFSGITGRTFPDDEVENERPIYVDIQQFKRSEPTLGKVSDLIFKDILCETRGRIVLTAQDGSVMQGLRLENITLSLPEIEDPKLSVPRSTSMQLSNFSPKTRAVRAAVVADNVQGLRLKDIEVRWPNSSTVPMQALCLRHCSDVVEDSPKLQSSMDQLERVLLIDS